MIVADVALSAEARTMIEHHGAETYPHECCGALYGEATDRGFTVNPLVGTISGWKRSNATDLTLRAP